MHFRCDNKIEGKEKDCGRYLCDVDEFEITIKCPRCKKIHKIQTTKVVNAKELTDLLSKKKD